MLVSCDLDLDPILKLTLAILMCNCTVNTKKYDILHGTFTGGNKSIGIQKSDPITSIYDPDL